MVNDRPRLTTQSISVLAAFQSGNEELSGAHIARTTKLASGTLYPILIRFEEIGWLKSRWESEDPRELGRPRRRLYHITGTGLREARQLLRDVVRPIMELAWR
jgi:DNA-binding PadR family transcriptional regulator